MVDVVRTITIRGKSDGVEEATAALKKLAEAQGSVAITSDTTTKSSLSIQAAYNSQTMRLDAAARASAKMATETRTADQAQQAGLITTQQHAERLELINEKYGKATLSSKAFEAATSGVNGQLIALAGGAGPIGVFLAALGPWGLAAAAGLGALQKAMAFVSDEAARMGTLSRSLRDSAETMGVTTDQLQALNVAAASAGVSTEKNAQSFERFTVQLNQLRSGAGQLYVELQAVDRGLVNELARTRDVTSAIDILATAYANTTDQVKRNAIARAAFGRNGFDEGNVLLQIAGGGGLDAYKAGLNQADVLTQAQIQHWALLSIEIEHATSLAKNNLAAIFTDTVLGDAKQFADTLLDISRILKEFGSTDQGAGFMVGMATALSSMIPGLNLIVGAANVARGIKNYVSPPTPKVPEIDPFGTAAVGGKYTQEKDAQSAQLAASQYKAVIEALGSAASASQKLHERQLTLFADFKSGKIDADTYSRALAGAGMEFATTAINARVSALGLMATATDAGTQAELRIAKANLDGANISRTQTAILKEAAQLRQTASQQDAAATFGLVSQQDILSQKTAEFNNLVKQLGLTEAQRAQGLLVVSRNARDAYENSVAAASALPQLTSLQFQYGNLNKQFDTFATSTLQQTSSGFADVLTGTVSLSNGFKNLGQQIEKSALQMVLNMTLVRTEAALLNAAFSGISGLVGGVNVSASANGLGAVGGASRASSPFGATLQAIRSGASSGGGIAGSQRVEIHNYSGGEVSEEHSTQPNGEQLTRIVIAKVADKMAKGHFDPIMRGRYGQARPTIQRG